MKKLVLYFLILSSTTVFGQTVLFTEDFDSSPISMTSSSNGPGAWALNNNLQNNGTNSDSAQVSIGDTLWLESSAFSTMGFSFLTLNFSQICKVDFFDKGIVEYSTNNGTSWTQLTAVDYTGSGLMSSDAFSAISYSIWDVANINSTPTNTWWQNESFDLSVAGSQMQVKIRFALIDADNNGPRSNYGWLVDDVEVIGSPCEVIPPTIVQTGVIYQGAVFGTGPYLIQADIQDASGIGSATLEYTLNSGALNTLTMASSGGNIYQATIPSAAIGDVLCYTIKAIDNTTCLNQAQTPGSGCTQFVVNQTAPPGCVGNPISSFNYSETFANFPSGDGRTTSGTLINDWANSVAGSHDWWVATSTFSTGTGPAADHSPGDANFLYIEATGNSNQTAILNTPCYNFSGLHAPKFSYWYHMNGTDMGELHVDIYNGSSWVLDVTPAVIGDQGGNWLFNEIDLTTYVGTIVQLRFRGIVGGNFRSDIAIDDIQIIEPITDDLSVINFISPNASSCNGSATEFITVEIENLGSIAQDTIPLAYRINNGAIVRDTAFFNLTTGSNFNHTFQTSFNMSAVGSYNIDAWVELPTDSRNENDSTLAYTVTTNAIQSNFPDTVTFDAFTVGTPGVFLNGWANDPSNAFDWYVHSGTTSSNQTGPTGDTTSASGSGNYVYYSVANAPQDEVSSIFSGCLDLGSTNKPELKFFYHMNGIDMGELHLDLSLNGFLVQDIIPAIIGDQGTAWLEKTVDLTPYKGDVRIIFRGIRGSGFRGDMAIDQVSLRDALSVGIEDSKLENQFSIFPNPFQNHFFVNTEVAVNAEIINAVGAKIQDVRLQQGVNKIDAANWSTGVYFIRFSTENAQVTKKFIKQ